MVVCVSWRLCAPVWRRACDWRRHAAVLHPDVGVGNALSACRVAYRPLARRCDLVEFSDGVGTHDGHARRDVLQIRRLAVGTVRGQAPRKAP